MRQQHLSSTRPGHVAAPRWRSALDALIGAPGRLHRLRSYRRGTWRSSPRPGRLNRYRHLHAEVIEDALRAYDCGPKPGAGK